MALTEKQKRFVSEYLVDLNATAAAGRAGYKDPNIGRQLITKNNIAEAIQEAIQKREKRTAITQDRVLEELAAIAFAKTTDYVCIDENGRVVLNETEQLSDVQKKAIESIQDGQFGIKLKMHDKMRALEMLGRHLGMFTGETGGDKGATQTEAHGALVDAIRKRNHED